MVGKSRILNRETGRQFIGFSVIGVVNTLIHLMIVIGLVELLSIHPASANGVAFIGANLFSFWANSRWSFRVIATSQRYMRFLAVSIVGLFVSILAINVSEALQLHYLAGVLLSFVFLPLITFLAHRNWTWKTWG
ncbi:GtrA family protein [Nitrosomonas sp. Is37]|uniref:GtrA family protein n=1 Tax=Nitrosomonas sp. Is37 TaxID=3080535 RepID=UPI00294B815D|nr:GtrA family protein [Nitrosomonas sp. Is37]MDV6344228.1 GtrA family protein [Nitrosomonas sp. Is37]